MFVPRFYFGLGIFFFLFSFCTAIAQQAKENNNAPVVHITSPRNGEKFLWNAIVPYTIRIDDDEDGRSEYNEIQAHEVILMTVFIADSSAKKKYLSYQSPMNMQALSLMGKSGCFTCHSAKGKLIGPSFEAVAKRYPNNRKSMDALSLKVMTGSTGTWSDLKMPAHPELTTEQVKEMIHWILKNNLDPNVNYLAGTTGAFRTNEKNEKETGMETYLLTATYLDHGTPGTGNNKKQSQHSIVLKK